MKREQNLLMFENGEPFARKCDHCGCGIWQGYMIGGGESYYCSDDCLYANLTEEEWRQRCDDDNGDSCYTAWEEHDYQYIVKDGKLIDIEL